MRDLAEIREDTDSIMSKPSTTGSARDEQMRRLLANSVEASALVHDQILGFKEQVAEYAKYTERNERVAKIISYTSLAVSTIAVLFGVWFSIQSSKSDNIWQDKQIQLLQQIGKELKN